MTEEMIKKAEEIAEELKNMMGEQIPTWFVIHQNAEKMDDGTGSSDPEEAAEMAVEEDAYSIVLIYDNGSNEVYDELVIRDTGRYQIEARQTNDTRQADGYGIWDNVGEWNADSAEEAINEWLDEQVYEIDGFERTGATTFRIDDAEYEARVAK